MKTWTFFYGAILFLLTFSVSTPAQTPETIEKELVGLYGKINENSAYSGNSDGDLLEKSNEEFKQKLLNHTKIASTLKHKFTELEKEISIATSEDGKFRVYSWDRLDGGTMHFFETVYQFQGADGKVYSKSRESEEGDSGSFVYDVFTVDAKAEKIYLVCSTSIGSTQDSYQNLRLFKIGKNELNDAVKLIKTKSGLTDSIGFGYNFFSVVDRKERPIKLILFDKKTQTFKIPVVIEDEKFPNGRVTDKFINYKFNGTYFIKVK
jgi:hypothetical protein